MADRGADAARPVHRPLDRPARGHGHLLDGGAAGGRGGGRLPAGLEADKGRNDGPRPIVTALLGAALGFAYFRALRLNARLYVTGGPLWRPVVLHVVRIVGVVAAFVLIAPMEPPRCWGHLPGSSPRASPWSGMRGAAHDRLALDRTRRLPSWPGAGHVACRHHLGGDGGADRRLRPGDAAAGVERPGTVQTVLELTVDTIEAQIGETMQGDARPFLPLLGTLFLFLAFANLSGLVPGVHPPTAYFETAAALALIVFVSVQYYGVRGAGRAAISAASPSPPSSCCRSTCCRRSPAPSR